MSVFDCSSEMSKYHGEKVTLRDKDRKDMRERRDNGRIRLKNGLNNNDHAQPKIVCSQGSYQMRTMIQDEDCDYDIDDGVYFLPNDLKDGDGVDLTPLQARQRVCDALSYDLRFASPAEVHNNCVRQEYQAGYHIDMPVYRIQVQNEGMDNEKEIYELASGNMWQVSDARAVTQWFRNAISQLNGEDGVDGLQMRHVVRLTKAFARSRKEWKHKTASGITLTRLVVDEFRPFKNRDDQALLETWKVINSRLATSTKVEHPVNATELAKEGDEKVTFFRNCLSDALEILATLEKDDSTRNEARDAWDSVFNTTYFGNLPDPRNSGTDAKTFFVATESKTDTRDDGNGRYGWGS